MVPSSEQEQRKDKSSQGGDLNSLKFKRPYGNSHVTQEDGGPRAAGGAVAAAAKKKKNPSVQRDGDARSIHPGQGWEVHHMVPGDGAKTSQFAVLARRRARATSSC